MTEKERELKSFNQCADALSVLDKRSILKVFHMLSIHFEVVDNLTNPSILDKTETNHYTDQDTSTSTPLIDERSKPKLISTPKRKTPAPKKGRSTNGSEPIYLVNFEFAPQGHESLRDYYKKFAVKSNFEKNLVFVHYLQEVIKTENISKDHIYSCYREVGEKIPNVPQSLKDTKHNKSWIDTSNMNDIKITRVGLNYISQDLQRND